MAKAQRNRTPAEEARALTAALREQLAHGLNFCRTLEGAQPEDRSALRRIIRAARVRQQEQRTTDAAQEIVR
jgi:hypothetical protein